VDCGQYFDGLVTELKRLANHDFMKSDKWRLGRWNATEIWPDNIIEYVRLQSSNGPCQGMDFHWRRAPGCNGVQHQRQRGNMIEVGMRQQDMVDAAHFVQRQITNSGAGINQYVRIDQKRRSSTLF
jgi:hypothetical protein